jgi:hypothetical protein
VSRWLHSLEVDAEPGAVLMSCSHRTATPRDRVRSAGADDEEYFSHIHLLTLTNSAIDSITDGECTRRSCPAEVKERG